MAGDLHDIGVLYPQFFQPGDQGNPHDMRSNPKWNPRFLSSLAESTIDLIGRDFSAIARYKNPSTAVADILF